MATRYIGTAPEKVDFELSITSRPKKSLGGFGAISRSIHKPEGIIVYDGISFDEATADIRIGNKIRKVGVFGGNSESGVIDITDSVDRGQNGHPTFEALVEEADSILVEFHSQISGQ